jgi:hypothetical protein
VLELSGEACNCPMGMEYSSTPPSRQSQRKDQPMANSSFSKRSFRTRSASLPTLNGFAMLSSNFVQQECPTDCSRCQDMPKLSFSDQT